MQLIKNVFKYLENYTINNIRLDMFDNESINNFVNYSPTLNQHLISTNSLSFTINNVVEPIIYNFDHVVNLSDRKTFEIDVYSQFGIDEDTVKLELCSGINGTASRGSFMNTNMAEEDTITTLVFNMGNINNTRLRQFSNIRSIKLTIPNDSITICGIESLNEEYMFTYDDLLQLIKGSKRYILNKLNMRTLPIDENLFEAIYKYSAFVIWERSVITPRNSKKGYDYLKKEVDDLIKHYLTRGRHPHLNITKETNKGRTHNTLDELYDEHKELINILYDYYK